MRRFGILFVITLSCNNIQASNTANENLCGNGVVDPGEVCDFNDPASSGCCNADCTKLPDILTICGQRSNGVCLNGKCKTRENQCPALDGNLLNITGLMFEGPFSSCSSTNDTSNGRISWDENSCSLSCQMQPIDPISKKVKGPRACVGLNGLHSTDSVDLANVFDGLLCGTQEIQQQIGVCSSGICSMEQCRINRCSRKGDCIRTLSGGVECNCDSGYSGDSCNLNQFCAGKLDICGECNGNGSSCSNSSSIFTQALAFVRSEMFLKKVLPGIIGGLILLVLLMVFLNYKLRKKNKVVRSFKTAFPLYGDTVNVFQSDLTKLKIAPPVPQLQFLNSPKSAEPKSVEARPTSIIPTPTEANQYPYPPVAAVFAQGANLYGQPTNKFNSSLPVTASSAQAEPVVDIDSVLNRSSQDKRISSVERPISLLATQRQSMIYDEVKVTCEYIPQMPDELLLTVGDILLQLAEYDDGWAMGYNARTKKEGVYPATFVEKIKKQ